MAQYAAGSGDSKYLFEIYEKYVGSLDLRWWFTKQFDIRNAAGLVPPLAFIQQMAKENDTSVENPQITPPSEPTDVPLVSSFLNCSYSQQDSGCPSGAAVCTGHTDDNQCSGKKPEECFNTVQCQYDSNHGSSCSCSP